MTLLSKIKYLLVASLGFLIIASPAFAAVNPNATRSNELKMRACEAKEQAVQTRMANVLRMSTNMMEAFDKISMRVEEFYQNRLVANGKTVQNYDTLIETIQTKKDAVQGALEMATEDSGAFSCAADNPKDLLVTFRKDMQAVKNALKDYRTSIKNLIVAVHSVNRTISTTPEPTGVIEQ